MNSTDGKENINYIDDKVERDYQEWRKNGGVHRLTTEEFARKAFADEMNKNEKLKEIGVKLKNICPECGKETETNEIVLPKNEYREYYCESCIEKIQLKKEKEEAEKLKIEIKNQKIREIENRKDRFKQQIPIRYRDVEKTSSPISENTTNSSIFYGGFGTGKTWKAYEMAHQLYTTLKISGFKHITEIGLLNEIKGGFSNNTFESRVNTFKEVDLLIVDEMGKNSDSDFNKAQIFEILNYRYDWEKKTILICNCEEKEELYDILSPAILDRFRERIVHFDGKSRRYKK